MQRIQGQFGAVLLRNDTPNNNIFYIEQFFDKQQVPEIYSGGHYQGFIGFDTSKKYRTATETRTKNRLIRVFKLINIE